VPRYLTGQPPRRELAIQLRMATAYERSMQATVEREIQRALDEAAEAIENRAPVELTAQAHVERLTRVYRATFEEVMPAFGNRLLTAAGKAWRTHLRRKDARGDFEAMIQSYLAQAGARAVVAATTTQDQIRAAVVAAEAANMTQDQIASQIRRGAPDLPGINLWTPRVRSLVIARTEVHTASTVSADAAAMATGVVERKEWVAAEDARTRPDHSAADGQTVDMGDAFEVGGVRMPYPGAAGAPAAQVVNCRCVTAYVTGD